MKSMYSLRSLKVTIKYERQSLKLVQTDRNAVVDQLETKGI
jgi:hypothetical protein